MTNRRFFITCLGIMTGFQCMITTGRFEYAPEVRLIVAFVVVPIIWLGWTAVAIVTVRGWVRSRKGRREGIPLVVDGGGQIQYPVARRVKMQGTIYPGLKRHRVFGRSKIVVKPDLITFQPLSNRDWGSKGHEETSVLPGMHRILVDETQCIANAEMSTGEWWVFRFAGPDSQSVRLVLQDAYGERYQAVTLPHFPRWKAIFM